MAATLLQGDKLASQIKEVLRKDIEDLKARDIRPHLTAVQVGENAASRLYIRQQQKACEEIGIAYELKELPDGTTQKELLSFIEQLNQDKAVTGVILMMPLPKGLDARGAQMKISPDKDVEGMHPANMGRLVYGNMSLAPCTAHAAVELLKSTGLELKGKDVVVVGHSEIVGKPLTLMLLSSQMESPTPTVCHIATKDLCSHTRRADIIFVAVGKPGLIKADMVKDGVVVIDIGINRVPVTDAGGNPVLNEKGKPKKKIVGDVDFEAVKEKASFITPVPGGVGVVTTAMLLFNTVESAKIIAARK